MIGKETISHLTEYILTYKFHIGNDIPKLLSDFKIFPSSFFARQVKSNSFVVIVTDDVFVVY